MSATMTATDEPTIEQEMALILERLSNYHRINHSQAAEHLSALEIVRLCLLRDRHILGEFSRGWNQRPGRWP